MANYTWLFPYEKVRNGSDIVIYGAGRMGQEYMKQIAINDYCKIVGVVDRNYKKYDTLVYEVSSPDNISYFDFDYVVVALELPKHFNEIREFLREKGISDGKIVAVFSRREKEIEVCSEIGIETHENLAYTQKDVPSVALKMSGALGGNVIRKKVVEALEIINPDIKIDIYSPAASTFLPFIYRTSKCLNELISDGGGLYIKNADKYDLALNVSTFIKVDYIEVNRWQERYPEFVVRLEHLNKVCNEIKMDFTQPMYTYYARAIRNGHNCYTSYDYDGALGITDIKVNIELDPAFKKPFEELRLNRRYITINYGNGVTMSNEGIVAKQWPRVYFEKFIGLFHEKYPEFKIIQLGAGNAVTLAGVDDTLFGQRIELSAWVLKKSFLHVDIEGGLVHLASQLGTKCAVIFGQTSLPYFGYAANINIQNGSCQDCNGMLLDVNACARHLKEPECMYKVSPKMVLEKIEEYMEIRNESS